MKKGTGLFILFILALSSCTSSNKTGINNDSAGHQDLSDFMIGSWIGSEYVTDIHGTYEKEYHLEFVNDNTLILQVKATFGGINDEFTYEFIGENRLLVENKRAKGGEWIINKEEENLLICLWSQDDCILFTRVE